MISIQMSTLVFVIYSLAICIIPSKSFQSVLFVKNVILNRHISSYRQSKQILYGENNMNKRDKNFDKIFDQIDFKRDQINDLPPMEQDPLYSVIKSIVVAGSSRKATGIIALRVTHLTEVARFMVVLEGTSRPQTQAIANAVEDSLEEIVDFTEKAHKQGDASGGWILLDYGSIMVHVMTPQMRNFYKLEKRWKDAQVVDITPILGQAEVDRARKLEQDKLDMIAEFGETDEDEDDKIDDEKDAGDASTISRDEEDPFWT